MSTFLTHLPWALVQSVLLVSRPSVWFELLLQSCSNVLLRDNLSVSLTKIIEHKAGINNKEKANHVYVRIYAQFSKVASKWPFLTSQSTVSVGLLHHWSHITSSGAFGGTMHPPAEKQERHLHTPPQLISQDGSSLLSSSY